MLNGSAAAKVTVTLCGPRNADHGTFPLTIRASAGKLIHTATVSLTVKGGISRDDRKVAAISWKDN
jgi:hypothetical protein